MLLSVNPKLPMRNNMVKRDFYLNNLGFLQFGDDYRLLDPYHNVRDLWAKFILDSANFIITK
ncbi:MAG: hypothetical protein NVS3B19_20640 [Ginsengibacter sp.]